MGSGMRIGWMGALAVSALAVAGGGAAEAAKWSRAYMNALPDEAFAVVEERPDGTRVRHLPHHDAQGRVDPAHLRNALSRWNQVQWADPASAGRAREHLLQHFRELGLPVPGGAGSQRWPAHRPRMFRSAAHPRVVAAPAPRPSGAPGARR